MANGFLSRLRGIRRVELFAVLTVVALLAMMALNSADNSEEGGKTTLERRLEDALRRIDGVGRVTAMVTEDGEGNAEGVLVIAEDLEDVEPYLCIQRAVVALLDVEPARVEIVGRWGRFGGGF